eukprot:GHUV01024778.1.p6 GENE.GHUV01024778.1~~GHUV01024778.1.p6  ORF type:complete len:111 (+),score=22.46 GHUV01024778.1:2314-2646(+)
MVTAAGPALPLGLQHLRDGSWQRASWHLEILQWLRQQEPPCPCDYAMLSDVTAAAEAGHIELLQWLRQQGPPCPWHFERCLSGALRHCQAAECTPVAATATRGVGPAVEL